MTRVVGMVLNATLGWGWADPLAGLVIAAVAVKEGREALHGENCGCAPGPLDAAGEGCTSIDGNDTCCATDTTTTASSAAPVVLEGPRRKDE
jgi:hypothetical protein